MSPPAAAQAPLTIAQLLGSMRGFFAQRGIASARLDAELLLASVLKQPRIYLYTHFDQLVGDAERDALRELARRRGRREPIAYILGRQEFYGREFAVDKRVLVPRPETEAIVDVVRDYLRGSSIARPRILDIGTGSGALAVTLAMELPQADVVACDISEDALAVAAHNVEAHQLTDRVQLHLADAMALSDPSTQPAWARSPFDVVVSNPPYLGEDERAGLMPDVRDHEPGIALFCAQQGRALLEAIIAFSQKQLGTPGLLVMENASRHTSWIQRAAAQIGDTRLDLDLAGHDRLCVAWRGEWPRPKNSAVEPGRAAQAMGSSEAHVETAYAEDSQIAAPDFARD